MKLNQITVVAALALGSLLNFGTVVNAQDAASNAPAASATPAAPAPPAYPGPGRGIRQPTFEKLVALLNLTDEEKPKVEPIWTEYTKQAAEIRKDTSLSREDKMAKTKSLREDTAAKLKDILTPEQFTKFQKLLTPGRRPAPAAAPAAPAAN
jgi:Spy/CpxP family protein refolding chaperone